MAEAAAADAVGLGDEGLILDDVRMEGRVSVVTFRHVVRAAAPSKDIWPVRGDFVTLFIDHTNVAGNKPSSRVERLWAHWTPQLPPFSATVAVKDAEGIAVSAAGAPGAAVLRPTKAPFVHPIAAGWGKLAYEILVGTADGTTARWVWVDAQTGDALWVRDANEKRSVEFGTTPILRPYRDEPSITWKPLPHAYVYADGANLSVPRGNPRRPLPLCMTDDRGAIPESCGIAPGTWLRVALRGPNFEQWTPAEDYEGTSAEPVWRSRPFQYEPSGDPIRVRPDPLFLPRYYPTAETATAYHYFEYIHALYDAAGINTALFGHGTGLQYFRTLGAPEGLIAVCWTDEQCKRCAGWPAVPPNTCDAWNFGRAPTDTAGVCRADVDCADGFPDAYCQFAAPSDVLGS
jgi:hypothetical protein